MGYTRGSEEEEFVFIRPLFQIIHSINIPMSNNLEQYKYIKSRQTW